MKNRFPLRPDRATANPRGAGRLFNARAWLLLSLCAAVTLVLAQKSGDESLLEHTAANLPVEQIGRFIEGVDPISIKWARAAMSEPHRAFELREKYKTPERKEAEAEALLAITDPEGFRKRKEAAESARGPKSPDEKAADAQAARDRAEALRVILNPVEAAREREKTKDAATRRREAIAEQSILNPHEFNQILGQNKTPELRQKEADVIYAFSDPEAFLADRQRLIKTGSKSGDKDVQNGTGADADGAITPPNNNSPKRPEKGTEGGGQ